MATKLLSVFLVSIALVAADGALAQRLADRCEIVSVANSSVPRDVLINNPAGAAAFDHGSQGLFGTSGQNGFREGNVRWESICSPLGQP
jgi:hypothetical protein